MNTISWHVGNSEGQSGRFSGDPRRDPNSDPARDPCTAGSPWIALDFWSGSGGAPETIQRIQKTIQFPLISSLVGVRVADPVAIQTRSSGRFSGRFRRRSSTGSRHGVALTSPLSLLETIQHRSGPLTHSAEKISLYSMTYEYL